MTDDKFDFMLDAALRDYSNAQPRAGFEQRVLRHVQTAPPVRRPYWKLGWAMAAIVLVLVILLFGLPEKQPAHEITRVAESPVQAIPQPVPIVAKAVKESRSLPKLDKFPRPEPLTAEERALLRFVQTQPEQARAALSLSAQIEEITIEPLKIEELQ